MRHPHCRHFFTAPLFWMLVAGAGALAATSSAMAGASAGADAAAQPVIQQPESVTRPLFDWKDEAAALEAVQVALTEVGDGSTYVWYRHGGRLSGQVRPTQSFKDTFGRVCRHIVVTLTDANRSRHMEGIACRLAGGDWQLDG